MSLRASTHAWKTKLLEQNPQTPEGVTAIAEIMDQWLKELSLVSLPGKANQIHSSEIWAVAQDLLSRGWLQNRARLKPRGYAGDYELFERICDFKLSDDPWGRAFDLYFQEQAAPRAVRARTEYVANAIVEVGRNSSDSVKLVIVGAGPAREVRTACERLVADERDRLEVVLIDIDPQALQYATDRLASCLRPKQLQVERHNLFRLPESAQLSDRISGAGLISCSGLFDYLDSSQSMCMLSFFQAALKPGGQGIVFQFSPDNPTRAYMEWIANWYLNYRTADEFLDLALAAGLPVASPLSTLVEGLAICLDWKKSQ